ncbi:MAG: hypothetical protein RLZZ214_4256 [Verrucomicrobiota bacterium]|jgi:hypothetical protein
MSKVKLDLKAKDFQQLQNYAKSHRDAMVGNLNFVTPMPTVAVYDAAYSSYAGKMDEIAAAEVALQTLRAERDGMRVVMESNLNGRGSYVETQSQGEASQILSAAFEIQADATPTTSMDKPYNMAATMGNNDGEIDVSCHAVPKAKSYIYEIREHSDTAAPGPWGGAKFGTRSSMTFSGLVSGRKYAFRVRALGPNELESPWSDEVICMAP